LAYSQEFLANLVGIVNEGTYPKWTVERQGKICEETPSMHDLLVFGDLAQYIIEAPELKREDLFGFPSVGSCLSAIGVAAHNKQCGDFGVNGYSWESEKEGKIIMTELYGTMENQLFIIQRDITEYQTRDPFGNEVLVKPIFDSETSSICGEFNCEPFVAAIALRYLKQTGYSGLVDIDSLIDYSKIKLAEHDVVSPRNEKWDELQLYKGYLHRKPGIPYNRDTHLDNDFTFQSIVGSYEARTSVDRQLILQSSDDQKRETESVNFGPDDIEHLLKGIIHASTVNRSGAHPSELIGLFEFAKELQQKSL
jgi:hypothetical protein